jgi:long-chain acyl-CoA synthetase
MRNDFVTLEATRGANLLGAYAVPIGWHATRDEFQYILNDADPRVLVAHFDLFLAVQVAVPASLPVLLVCADEQETQAARRFLEDHPARSLSLWDVWIASQAPWSAPARPQRGTIIYTSGTTGRPKGVKRLPATPDQAARYTRFYRELFDIGPTLRAYVGGPLYHSTANAFARSALEVADLLALQTRFDAEGLLRLIEEQAITHMVLVPTMFVRLLRLPEEIRLRFDLSSLKRVYHTGAACPANIKREMIAWFGPIFVEVYGSTEVGAAVIGTSEDWLDHPGTVGRPVAGTTLRILDEDKRECPPGTPGEIFLRCELYADFTYHNSPALRAEVEHQGLITAGDMGYVDDAGFLYLCDRKKDMIITGGVNVYPAEVEAQLIEMPNVQDCAIFGLPDDEYGEIVTGAVQLMPDAQISEADIRAWLRERLSAYKIPKRIFFADSLPRTETGKISKAALRQRFVISKNTA